MFKLSVICPEGAVYEGEVDMVTIPGLTSNFSVLKDHAPLVSELDVGLFTIYEKDKKIEFSIQGGCVEVLHNNITALVEKVSYPDDINPKDEEIELENLIARPTSSDSEYEEHEREIKSRRVNILLAQDSS